MRTRFPISAPAAALAGILVLMAAGISCKPETPAADQAAPAPVSAKAPAGRTDTNSTYTAEEFDEIAQTVFRPIYPHLAAQVKADYGIAKGLALDAGSGPGYWAIELAKITELKVTALDIDPAAVKIAARNIREAGLEGRVEAVEGDVQKLPFDDASMDLVVSRGSYLFWPDKALAFREIWRVLKPGGAAFVGGGMGNLLPPEDRTRIQEIMVEKNIGPPLKLETTFEQMGEILRAAGIPDFKISHDEGCLCGLWVEFRKPKG